MVLLVDGAPIGSVESFFSDDYPQLQERSQRFAGSPTINLPPQELLYVCQREYGAVQLGTPDLRYIGTDDATTCHIVALVHTGSRAVCLGHLDGNGTTLAVAGMLSLIKELSSEQSGRLELHICGGFCDPDGTSRKLSFSVLGEFHRSTDSVHLMTACITDYNDVIRNGVHFPIIYGIAADIVAGTIFKASYICKSPDIVLRSGRFLSDSREMVKLYDNHANVLGIEPFNYQKLPESILEMSDEEILEKFSTSPAQEPAGFAENIRKLVRYTNENPDPMTTVFVGGRPVLYTMIRGSWVQVPSV